MVGAASFVVEGAGTKGIDGTYTRTDIACAGADVFRKASTSFALLRRGTDDWCLVDLRSRSTTRWTLRCEELYRSTYASGVSVSPPTFGWTEVVGLPPAPIVRAAKGEHLSPSKSIVFSAHPDAAEVRPWPRPGSVSGSGRNSRGPSQLALAATSLLTGSPSSLGASSSSPALLKRLGDAASPATSSRKPSTVGSEARPKEAQKFLCCFRVVLMRPSAKVPWGFVWDKDVHARTGSRVVESILDDSPLSRWNFWQDMRGRPDLCVMDSDQLLRVDGKWAWHDHEVGEQDADSASAASTGHAAFQTNVPIVLDFARAATREPVPLRPQLDVNEATQTLCVDWSRSKSERIRGWALCIQDMGSGDWYAVDGFTSTAMPLSPSTNDVGAIRPADLSIMVSVGLPSGRTYAACVAGLGSSGWTAFSGMSRPLALPSFRNYCVAREEREGQGKDDWPARPRFACPSRLVAGFSAPVELVNGPRAFSGRRRRLLLEMIMRGPPDVLPGHVRWGIRLHVGSAERAGRERETITVYSLEPGLAAARWCQSQRSATFHGAAVPLWLCPGDVIASANGLTQPAAILREVRRGPGSLVLLVDRETEGPRDSNEPEDEDPDDQELIRISTRLDQDAAKAAEAVEWFVMLPEREGKLATKMVGSDLPAIEEQLKEAALPVAYRNLFNDAEERTMIMAHIPTVITITNTVEEMAASKQTRGTTFPGRCTAFGVSPFGPGGRLNPATITNTNESPTGQTSLAVPDSARGLLSSRGASKLSGASLPAAGRTGSRPATGQESPGSSIALGAQFFNRRNPNQPRTNMQLIFNALRLAMADPCANEKFLSDSIDLFETASKDVRTSRSGLALVHRAKALRSLWEWRRSCAQARAELAQAHQDMLREEARGPPAVSDTPPYDMSGLHAAVERAEQYSSEFLFEYMEAVESLARLKAANERCMAQRRMEVAAADPKEHPSKLEAAVAEAEAVGVDPGLLAVVRRGMADAVVRRRQEECHDSLFAATQDLQAALGLKEVPPAGTSEQRRVREALTGCGLPNDHELVLRAEGLLKEWEKNHSSLRAEVKLVNAERRCLRGFQLSDQTAGPTLASTIAEVAQRGVSADLLEHAKLTLSNWRVKQVNACLQNLKQAINAKSEEFLQEAIKDAEIGGVPASFLEDATQKLLRLRLQDEVTGALTAAMESGDVAALELAIQQAHDGMFVEEETPALMSASLQVELRLWAVEFNHTLKMKEINGMDRYVPAAQEAVQRARVALKDMIGDPHASEVAVRTLERELRTLDIVLPKFEDFTAVRSAEDQLRRALGAVEKYARDLPVLIARAKEQLPRGLSRVLLAECVEHSKNYDKTVEALNAAVEQPALPLAQLKAAVIKARLAGAEEDLVNRGLSNLKDRDPELWQYTTTELELLLALTEADDIVELDVEGRFLRLQDAAAKAKRLEPPLSSDTLAEVDEVYLALAAEQSLKFAMRDAEAALANRWAPTEVISACAGKLEQACLSAQQSALSSVKDTMLGPADKLQELLQVETNLRLDTKQRMSEIRLESPVQDLKVALRDAREAFVQENLLTPIYAELRKRQLEFIAKDFRAARVQGSHQVALAYWHRGVALEAARERSGEDWLQDHLPDLESRWTRGTTVVGHFGRDGGGSFGSQTWRENPYFFIRPVHEEGQDPGTPGREYTPGGSIQVTVYVVGDGAKTATLEVHAVQNKKQVAFAGCGTQLMPGFHVLASSSPEQDIPHCSFKVDVHSEELQPVFIVPSVAVGEEGGFRLLVEASRPVEIVEVGPSQRLSWQLVAEEDVEWAPVQPHSILMGGGRPMAGAPRLSWYRNPQFEVEFTGEEVASDADSDHGGDGDQSPHARSSSESTDIVATPDDLLFVLLVPADKRCVHPAAIHLMRNKDMSSRRRCSGEQSSNRQSTDTMQQGLKQNPWHHEMLASSCGLEGSGYSTDSELGAVCAVQRKHQEKIIVVPSLESDKAAASYKIRFFSTTSIAVTRV